MGGMVLLSFIGKIPDGVRYFSYNNPLILLSSICIFTFFASLKIQSKYINLIATGMFGVFLMHTPPEIIPIRNAKTAVIYASYNYLGIFIEAILLFFILTLVTVPIEYVNKKILKSVHDVIKK